MRSIIRSRIFARTLMSSIETGSSATSRSGPRMIARAIAARCFWPPERSPGYLSTKLRRRREADQLEGLGDLRRRLARVPGRACGTAAGRDRGSDRHRRVQRRVRVLEDHLQVPAQRPNSRSLQAGELLALELARALAGGDEAEQRAPERRLARARLADEPEHLALAQVEADPVDGLHRARLAAAQARANEPCSGEVDLEVADLDQGVAASARVGVATSRFLRDGERLALERLAAAGGDLVLGPVQPALRAARRPRGRDSDRLTAARRPASRPGSAGGSGTPAAGRRGPAARPGWSAARWSTARSSSAAARASTGARAAAKTCLAPPCSTIRPAYMTATRSQASATIPRLWVISSSAVSKLRRRSARMRRIWRLDEHVERGRRLVGDDQAGPQHERQRDHDPLAHAARELVRVLLVARRRDAHAAQRLERALARLLLAEVRLVCAQHLVEVLRDLHQRVEPRHRLLEDQPQLRPAQRAQLGACDRGLGRARRSATSPAGAALSGSRPSTPRPSVDLPQPDSPTRPTVSPGA